MAPGAGNVRTTRGGVASGIKLTVITSLQVMDLIFFLEQLSGKLIEVDDLKPGVFRDIDTSYHKFFASESKTGE